MNYLAHAYLSFTDPGILTGNMISDFVKGKAQFDYPEIIQKGIVLHRAIDEFTDNHEATHLAKTYFKIPYRLYAGAFVDVVYDHFLANDKAAFATKEHLNDFCQSTYTLLENNTFPLPVRFRQMLPHMKQQNWLYHYRLNEGIEKSFGGLVRRATYLTESAIAYKIFNEHYGSLSNCYQSFFPALKAFAVNRLAELNDN